MATCRDWLATLWAASFKGFPFYVEQDGENGGRRVVIHEFPKRDDPFLEDLGEMSRAFEATAYVASDRADIEAIAFTSVLASQGPGMLVLPTHGPRFVRLITFSRERSKDKHGYIGFKIKFAREGATSAIASVPMLANGVFAAVSTLAGAAATAFGAVVAAKGMVDYVISSATGSIVSAAAAIDAIRTSVAVDADISASVRDATAALIDAAPSLVSRLTGANGDVATEIFDAVRDLGSGMRPEDAMRVFPDLASQWASAVAPPGSSQNQITAIANANEVARVVRLAALSGYAEAVTRATFAARPEGITARADAAEWFEAELDDLNGAPYASTYVAAQEVRNGVVSYLTRLITDLAPVVTVTANISMPSLFWSWRLYADPERAGELVARNRVAHPSFMPKSFEALAR